MTNKFKEYDYIEDVKLNIKLINQLLNNYKSKNLLHSHIRKHTPAYIQYLDVPYIYHKS